MRMARRQDGETASLSAAAFLLVVLAPCRLAGQDTPPPTERYRPTTAFPAAVGLMLSTGSYGDRARQSDTITHKLSRGLAIGGQVQFPVTHRLGLIGSASISARRRLAEHQGDPFSSSVEKVRFRRLAAGIGFRFRPQAPVFFAGTFVYNLISPGPVEFQDADVSETGGGFGIGYDFGRSARTPLFGRFELWNYWMKPSAANLLPTYEAKSRTHDLSIALSVNYRLKLSRARAGSGR